MIKSRFILSIAETFVIVLMCNFGGVVLAQEEDGATPELPGYYEFFVKTGKLTRLESEVKRDDQIQTGKITPVAVNEPVIDLTLPDGFGKLHSTRDYVGKKNLVLITGRAWW